MLANILPNRRQSAHLQLEVILTATARYMLSHLPGAAQHWARDRAVRMPKLAERGPARMPPTQVRLIYQHGTKEAKGGPLAYRLLELFGIVYMIQRHPAYTGPARALELQGANHVDCPSAPRLYHHR